MQKTVIIFVIDLLILLLSILKRVSTSKNNAIQTKVVYEVYFVEHFRSPSDFFFFFLGYWNDKKEQKCIRGGVLHEAVDILRRLQ